MNPNQVKAIILGIAGVVDIDKIKYNPQQIIRALHDGRLGRILNRVLANREWIAPCPPPLVIDRSTPVQQLGPMLPVWLGQENGTGLKGEPDRDRRSFGVTTFDARKVLIVSGLVGTEKSVTGQIRRNRIRSGKIVSIDFHIGWDLYSEAGQSTLRWLYDVHDLEYIETDDVLRHTNGQRVSLALERRRDNSWGWHCGLLHYQHDINEPTLGFEES